jgi:tRNA dimethylallyltransferase
MQLPTMITIQGQTASGKSELAVDLALKLGSSWIIGMDSRQIYKNLNLGTGKIEGNWEEVKIGNSYQNVFMYRGVPHFLIDEFDPAYNITLVDIMKRFNEICAQTPLPKYLILCGGTGLYIKAIVEQYNLQRLTSPQDIHLVNEFRSEIQQLSLDQLQSLYSQQHPLHPLTNSEFNNPRRLINKIISKKISEEFPFEIVQTPKFEIIHQFAIQINQNQLHRNIQTRIHDRINAGMIQEIESLQYLGRSRLFDLGLEYRYTSEYINGTLDYDTYINTLFLETKHYAKRQLTWLNKQNVTWVKNLDEIISNRFKN